MPALAGILNGISTEKPDVAVREAKVQFHRWLTHLELEWRGRDLPSVEEQTWRHYLAEAAKEGL